MSKRSHSKVTEKSKKRSEKAGKGSIKTKASAMTKKSRNYSNQDVKTKSVFSKLMDQDPYPLFLNQNHLEQLIKIHIVLSMVSNDKTKALVIIK